MSKHGFFSKITKCAALALVFGVVGGTAFSGVNYFLGSHFSGADTTALEAESSRDTMQIQPTSTVTNVISKDISNIVEEAMPSVVAITGMTQQEIRSFFGQGQTIESEKIGRAHV